MWENEYAFSSFKLKVMEEFGGDACVGGTQWPGGVRVARYLDNPLVFPPEAQTWKGKTLLDLGSGCGLVAAVAAKLGAKVLAVDKDIVMDILKENLEANGVLAEAGVSSADASAAALAGGESSNEDVSDSPCYLQEGKVVVEEFYWGPEAEHKLAPFDVVVAAACLYMPKTVPLLLETLWNVTDPHSLTLLCCILGQNTLECFLEEIPRFFEYTAYDDTDGKVVGTSEEGNLSPLDVATRILVLRRKEEKGGIRIEGKGKEEEEDEST